MGRWSHRRFQICPLWVAWVEMRIVDIFETNIVGFSKYKLAKAYLRWTRTNTAANLTANEQAQWASLIANVNKALK